MTREEIIQGLQFTIDMFLYDPSTGETITEPRNDMDKTTIDACKGAIELLQQESCGDSISRKEALEALEQEEPLVWCDGADEIAAHNQWSSDVDTIKNMPSVQPKPKTGQWVLLDECSNSGYYCSECHKKLVKEGWSGTVKKIKFCPNCGAKMVEPQESEET